LPSFLKKILFRHFLGRALACTYINPKELLHWMDVDLAIYSLCP
jgi:hypothetical protein